MSTPPKRKQPEEQALYFAVIDTETNWHDEVMSIGIVIADAETKEKIDAVYYIIEPEYRVGGMYSGELRLDEEGVHVMDRESALMEIKQWMDTYRVQKLFAYNAAFDKRHLPEYAAYRWYDIMRLAAYRQYNKAIPDTADCCKTGRLKWGYGVESVLKMLSKDSRYRESHNAVSDAEDELQIMRLLGYELSVYETAFLADKKTAGNSSAQDFALAAKSVRTHKG